MFGRKERLRKLNISFNAACRPAAPIKEANLTNKMIILAFGVAMTPLATSAFAADLAAVPPPPPAVVVYPDSFAPVVAAVALPVTVATAVIAAAAPPPVVASY